MANGQEMRELIDEFDANAKRLLNEKGIAQVQETKLVPNLLTEVSELCRRIIDDVVLTDKQKQQVQYIIELMRKTCPNFPQKNEGGTND
jgi:Mor family transcriptional regulator